MKITLTKIGVAKSQLIEAIRLFFEQRDPVSIHTLVGAALQILHDHIDDVGIVWDENLLFHYDSIHIKDEYRSEWKAKVNEARNFFKHAERDLKDRKTTLEFETAMTQFHIFEAMRCLKIVEKDDFIFSFEMQAFWSWFCLKYPNFFKPEVRILLAEFSEIDPDNLGKFNEIIALARENPILVESMKRKQA